MCSQSLSLSLVHILSLHYSSAVIVACYCAIALSFCGHRSRRCCCWHFHQLFVFFYRSWFWILHFIFSSHRFSSSFTHTYSSFRSRGCNNATNAFLAVVAESERTKCLILYLVVFLKWCVMRRETKWKRAFLGNTIRNRLVSGPDSLVNEVFWLWNVLQHRCKTISELKSTTNSYLFAWRGCRLEVVHYETQLENRFRWLRARTVFRTIANIFCTIHVLLMQIAVEIRID